MKVKIIHSVYIDVQKKVNKWLSEKEIGPENIKFIQSSGGFYVTISIFYVD